jgi:predicted metal-dependent hydrolase
MPDPRQLSFDFNLPDDEVAAVLALKPETVASPAPIPYSIKVSARARQVYLRAVPGRGLVVTIPKRFPKRDVPDIVESQRSWVEQALADLAAQVPQEFRSWPPQALSLAACDTQFDIKYAAQRGDAARATWLTNTQLLIEADSADRVAVASCLALVLKDRAKKVLGPWLARLASEHGFNYKRLVVRGQRSVWGSYSSSGTLSLNYKLLFLQPR